MIKIAFIAPYQELLDTAKDVFAEQNHPNCQLEEIVGIGFDFVQEMRTNADVIVARGVTAAACRHFFQDIPVVELKVTGYDVIRTLHQVCLSPINKVAVVGSRNMFYGAESLVKVLNINISTFWVEQDQDAADIIKEIKSQDYTMVIGGAMTCRIAANRGLNTAVIESGKESVWNALKEAKLVADVRRAEKERSQLFKTILDYANEGIVAVNHQSNITMFNAAAEKLTGQLEQVALGQPIEQMIPHLDITNVITTGKPELKEVISVGRAKVMANCIPIMVGDSITGGVVTFQDVTKIQQLETRIREKIYSRGHVAKLTFDDIIGNSAAVKECINTAKQFSAVDSSTLIYGNTGTGKEVFAQSIHNASSRANGPFIALNCGALPENLLESELFGYVEGAFTGAVKGGKAGVFELAHGGTIFLDEIANTTPHMQARLLRVLQEKEVRRIGSDRVIPIDVRVIAATNKSLPNLVDSGEFRKDLYYRLNVLYLMLPDLCQRGEDIPLLLNHFLNHLAVKFNKVSFKISPSALDLLQQYSWPGNIRELQNFSERLAVQTAGGLIAPADIYRVLPELNDHQPQPINFSIKETQAQRIANVLAQVDYNQTKAAEILGISRTTLWRKIKEYNLL
jgi:PAS domain S-box-containing protein